MTTDFRVYPRLPLAQARRLCEQLLESYADGGINALTRAAAAVHPNAAPVPTGGRVASQDEIWDSRQKVLAAIAPWLTSGTTKTDAGRSQNFDISLGRALHENLSILPADAAHDGTWSFLALVVFPDVVALRFPELHVDRFLGKYPRNALRRVWLRQEVLGDLLSEARYPLGEDEATGIFERTALARNRRLARLLSIEVMSRPEAGRSTWARELLKKITYATGPLMLDHLSDSELRELIGQAVDELKPGFPSLGPPMGNAAWSEDGTLLDGVAFPA